MSHHPDFETLAETVAAAIFIVQDDSFRYVNKALETMSGYTRDELLTMPFWQMAHPDYRDAIRGRGLARQRGSDVPTTYEFKIVTKSGEERWFQFGGSVIEFEGRPAVLGTAFDITERKQIEQSLQESEALYRMLFEMNVDGVCVIVDGTIAECNARFAELMGRPTDDLLGHSPTDFPVPEERAQAAERVRAVMSGGAEFPSPYRVLRPDSSILPVEVASRLIQYQGKTAILSVVRDISERVRAQEALLQARDEVEGRVERQMLGRNPYQLSFRELTVLHLVAAGRADKEIADDLGISPLTAQKHVSNILSKMSAASRTEASVRAVKEGLLGER